MGSLFRTIRLKEEEAELIDSFLEKNPLFDFSSLARVALASFVTKPDLTLVPASLPKRKPTKDSKRDQREKSQ